MVPEKAGPAVQAQAFRGLPLVAETGEQAVRTLAQAEQLLLQSGVVLPLYTSMSYYAVSSEVQGAWIDPGEGVIYIKYITKS